nr:hypothetical protein [Nitrospirota bacterium]
MRISRRIVKKAIQRGRSERRGDAYSLPYVEPLSDARTKLADFFTILLESLLQASGCGQRHLPVLSLQLSMPTVPQDIAAGFFLLSLAVLAVLATLLIRCSRNLRWVVTIMVAWTALTAVLAASGTLADFETGHPRIPILVLTQLVFVVWLAWFSRWSGDLAHMPQMYLVGLQCFRIPVELMMAELAAQNLLAVAMTFYGRNFDVLT